MDEETECRFKEHEELIDRVATELVEWAENRFHGVHEHLDHITKTIRRAFMTTQADVDAITSALDDLGKTLSADDGAIQAELAELAKANPGIDLSGITAAVQNVKNAVDATTALVPAPTDSAPTEPAPVATPVDTTPVDASTPVVVDPAPSDPVPVAEPVKTTPADAAPVVAPTEDGSAPTA